MPPAPTDPHDDEPMPERLSRAGSLAIHPSRPMRESLTWLIACFNCGPYIEDCIESLLAQTDPSWRALILDDASTDDSAARIAARPDPRIRVLRNDRNIGYIATLERLIDRAETDIVAILDADDAVAPAATAAILDACLRGAGFVHSRFAVCDSALRETGPTPGGPVPPGGTAIIDGPVGAVRGFRRSVYRRTPGLDPTMLYAEDRDLVYKLEEVVTPVFIDEVLYRYRAVPHSQSNDPAKRRIGLKNVRRARRAALRRRGVRGLSRWVWELWIAADRIASDPALPSATRRIADAAGASLARVIRAASPQIV